jgi:hypothetical protein
MIKKILTAGQIIDIITRLDGSQYFCVIDFKDSANLLSEIIYKDNDEIKYFDIERVTIDSTIIVMYNPENCLTDEEGNIFDSVKYAYCLTENKFNLFL